MNFLFKICCTLIILWFNCQFIYSDIIEHQLIPSATVTGKAPHKFDLKSLSKLQEAVKKLEKEIQQQKFDEHYGIKKEEGSKKHKNGKTVLKYIHIAVVPLT